MTTFLSRVQRRRVNANAAGTLYPFYSDFRLWGVVSCAIKLPETRQQLNDTFGENNAMGNVFDSKIMDATQAHVVKMSRTTRAEFGS